MINDHGEDPDPGPLIKVTSCQVKLIMGGEKFFKKLFAIWQKQVLTLCSNIEFRI